MDSALALWYLNPAATYVLSEDGTAILAWRGPGDQPTEQELAAAWAAYQASPHAATHRAVYERVRATRDSQENAMSG